MIVSIVYMIAYRFPNENFMFCCTVCPAVAARPIRATAAAVERGAVRGGRVSRALGRGGGRGYYMLSEISICETIKRTQKLKKP